MVGVLFVCLGNICRSPTGEGLFQDLVKRKKLNQKITVDSAGTSAFHIGEPPDPRSQAAAKLRGIDLSKQRARRVEAKDFEKFDYLLAMDAANKDALMRLCPPGSEHKIHLMMDFGEGTKGQDVPDPYYVGGEGFEVVLNMIENASNGLLKEICNKHL
ncbi:MAG: phosphotyrosine protein phosphatase [Magnetovibrio sp.]|nr:phosphotyrosine protein phosphatase [Magnetovibrio sp.]MBH90354.1 phosphotyrosine protein phosphatase [Magnetovibrio sp.]